MNRNAKFIISCIIFYTIACCANKLNDWVFSLLILTAFNATIIFNVQGIRKIPFLKWIWFILLSALALLVSCGPFLLISYFFLFCIFIPCIIGSFLELFIVKQMFFTDYEFDISQGLYFSFLSNLIGWLSLYLTSERILTEIGIEIYLTSIGVAWQVFHAFIIFRSFKKRYEHIIVIERKDIVSIEQN